MFFVFIAYVYMCVILWMFVCLTNLALRGSLCRKCIYVFMVLLIYCLTYCFFFYYAFVLHVLPLPNTWMKSVLKTQQGCTKNQTATTQTTFKSTTWCWQWCTNGTGFRTIERRKLRNWQYKYFSGFRGSDRENCGIFSSHYLANRRRECSGIHSAFWLRGSGEWLDWCL